MPTLVPFFFQQHGLLLVLGAQSLGFFFCRLRPNPLRVPLIQQLNLFRLGQIGELPSKGKEWVSEEGCITVSDQGLIEVVLTALSSVDIIQQIANNWVWEDERMDRWEGVRACLVSYAGILNVG